MNLILAAYLRHMWHFSYLQSIQGFSIHPQRSRFSLRPYHVSPRSDTSRGHLHRRGIPEDHHSDTLSPLPSVQMRQPGICFGVQPWGDGFFIGDREVFQYHEMCARVCSRCTLGGYCLQMKTSMMIFWPSLSPTTRLGSRNALCTRRNSSRNPPTPIAYTSTVNRTTAPPRWPALHIRRNTCDHHTPSMYGCNPRSGFHITQQSIR
ncbi:hypothetical protein CPB85DRAFT_287676 [Mucidula mucida]|nr:hypothetical protein CPB85DRAFT_287676 [Mucidula mucida]